MINHFPPQNKGYTFLQTNRSDDLGSLWSSFNLDFQSNLGVIRNSPRMIINTSQTDTGILERPVAFKFFKGRMFAITGTRIVRNSDGAQPQDAFVEDTSTNAQTDYLSDVSDMEIFNGELYATTTDALYSLDQATGGTWTARGTALNSGVPHMLTYFKKFDRLYYMSDQGFIRSIDTTYAEAASGDYTIDVGTSSQLLCCMRASSDYIWIGIFAGGSRALKGRVLQWDGISAQATNQYTIDAQGIMAMTIKDDVPYIMDSRGRLLKFSGYNFEEIGRLPVPVNKLLTFSSTVNDKFIHPNGLISTENNTILALIGNILSDSTSTIPENCPSGIWEWAEGIGFTHKYSFTYNHVGSATLTDFGQNKITIPGALSDVNYPSTNASRNGTLMAGAKYYTSASAVSYAIFIDDSNNTVQKKGYFVTTWFNSEQIEDKWTRLWEVHRRFLQSTDSIVYKYRLNEEDPLYADITWINTTSFSTATDPSAYGPTATGFNGTIGGEVEGIQGQGSGHCAHITSITGPSGGLYTVTIDTALPSVSVITARVRFQKWVKLFPEVTGQVKSWEQMAIGGNNTRVQIKGYLTFQGDDEFQKLAIFSNSDIKIVE